METCKYCGQQLQFIGEQDKEYYFGCDFCDMTFPLSETSSNRKRKMSVPEYINPLSYDLTTKELLASDTITLYYTLKDTNAFWFHLKGLLEKSKVKVSANQLPQPNEEDPELDEIMKQMKDEYTKITKKKFVIENIILERTGFLPPKITEDFLSEIYEQGQLKSQQPMYVYIK